MKPHPRIRKTVKWGGAAISVLFLAGWLWSGWNSVSWIEGLEYQYDLNAGCLDFWGHYKNFGGLKPKDGWHLRNHPLAWNWKPGMVDVRARTGWRVPLWIPIVMIAMGTGRAWRLDTRARRRARLSLCPNCHYDRTGLAAGAVCPECGSPPT